MREHKERKKEVRVKKRMKEGSEMYRKGEEVKEKIVEIEERDTKRRKEV